MIICPYCGGDNIPGVDQCENCDASLSDLYLAEPATGVEKSLLRDHLPELEPRPPVTVRPETPVGDVLNRLVEEEIGCVLVTEGEKLLGIFSERDAINRLGVDAAELSDRPISEFMTKDPQTLPVSAKIAFAVKHMDVGHYRHIPMTDENGDNVTGIISVRDFLRYLTDRMSPV